MKNAMLYAGLLTANVEGIAEPLGSKNKSRNIFLDNKIDSEWI